MAKKIVPKLARIGLSDKLDIPSAKLYDVPCKIDTGAYNCSIHCTRIRLIKTNVSERLEFTLLDKEFKEYSGVKLSTKRFRIKKVKSSNGKVQNRYQVVLTIRLFDQSIDATFNLSKRHNMKYPILLGRKFLAKQFLVDVSKRNLSFKQKKLAGH